MFSRVAVMGGRQLGIPIPTWTSVFRLRPVSPGLNLFLKVWIWKWNDTFLKLSHTQLIRCLYKLSLISMWSFILETDCKSFNRIWHNTFFRNTSGKCYKHPPLISVFTGTDLFIQPMIHQQVFCCVPEANMFLILSHRSYTECKTCGRLHTWDN